MGKKPVEVQREIAEQRAYIERRLARLQDRVRDDVRDAGESVSSQVNERLHISEYVEERPLTSVLGAFGAGIMLGMASDRAPMPSFGKRGDARSSRGSGDNGIMSELMGTASGLLSGSLGNEMRNFLRDVMGDGGSPATSGRYDGYQRDSDPSEYQAYRPSKDGESGRGNGLSRSTLDTMK